MQASNNPLAPAADTTKPSEEPMRPCEEAKSTAEQHCAIPREVRVRALADCFMKPDSLMQFMKTTADIVKDLRARQGQSTAPVSQDVKEDAPPAPLSSTPKLNADSPREKKEAYVIDRLVAFRKPGPSFKRDSQPKAPPANEVVVPAFMLRAVGMEDPSAKFLASEVSNLDDKKLYRFVEFFQRADETAAKIHQRPINTLTFRR